MITRVPYRAGWWRRLHLFAGCTAALALISIAGVWFAALYSPGGEHSVEFRLASPWPAPEGILASTGTFLGRKGEAPVLVFADREGDIHWLLNGQPEHPRLLGVRSANLPLLAADLNHDGDDELVLASLEDQLMMFDGREGSRFATTDWFAEPITCAPAASSERSAGSLIAVHGRRGKFGIYLAADASTFHREQYFNGQVPGCGIWYDIDADGHDDYAAGSDDGQLIALSGATGKLSTLDLSAITRRTYPIAATRGLEVAAPLCFSDYNGDGKGELVALTRQGDLLVIDLASQVVFAHASLPVDSGVLHDDPGPLLADLDLDGLDEIIVAHAPGSLYAFEAPRLAGRPLSLFWPPVPIASECYAPALADLTGDRIPEVILSTRGGELIVVNGRRGDYIFRTQLQSTGPPLLADADGDGEVEIFVASDQQWNVIDTDVAASSRSLWLQWRGGAHRQGAFRSSDAPRARPWWTTCWLAMVFAACGSIWLKT